MSSEKNNYQQLLEQLAGDPALKEKLVGASAEEFMSMCRECGLGDISAEKAEKLHKQLKDAMGQGLSDEEFSNIAGGFLGYFIQKHNPEANR